MPRVKMTLSLNEDVVLYLRSQPNASALVSEAVQEYRAHELARRLEEAYLEGVRESAELAKEWEGTSPPVES